MKIRFECTYSAHAEGVVTLPDGKTWDDDVKD